jgi:hypothetical protein
MAGREASEERVLEIFRERMKLAREMDGRT